MTMSAGDAGSVYLDEQYLRALHFDVMCVPDWTVETEVRPQPVLQLRRVAAGCACELSGFGPHNQERLAAQEPGGVVRGTVREPEDLARSLELPLRSVQLDVELPLDPLGLVRRVRLEDGFHKRHTIAGASDLQAHIEVDRHGMRVSPLTYAPDCDSS